MSFGESVPGSAPSDGGVGLTSYEGVWIDVQEYSNIILTFKNHTKTVDTAEVKWYARYDTPSETAEVVEDDILYTDTFSVPGETTKSRNLMVKARWVKVTASTHKKYIQFIRAPTQTLFRDSASDIIKIKEKSMYTSIVDGEGTPISKTDPVTTVTHGNSLYITSAHTNGNSFNSRSNMGLAGTLVNTTNTLLRSTKSESHNALYIINNNNNGENQAGTHSIIGANHGGVALYNVFSDKAGKAINTTTSTGKNALHVHNVDALGKSITSTNKFNIKYTHGFQIDTLISSPIVTSNSANISNVTTVLRTLFISNTFPRTLWLKIYDLSIPTIEDVIPILNLPVTTMGTREIPLSNGVVFVNGITVKISGSASYTDTDYDVPDDYLVMECTYTT